METSPTRFQSRRRLSPATPLAPTLLYNNTVLARTTNGFDSGGRLSIVSDGVNSATYSYVANSPLVSQIDFKNSGTLRMSTTKSYDALNRLTNIVSSTNTVAVAGFAYSYNSANQRTAVTREDGSYWIYTYDGLGQVTSGKKYWGDGTPVAGQQFEYAFDQIGNRTSSRAGGDQWGANLRYATYAANNLNQYTSRTVPAALDVVGSAKTNATVTVNNQPTYRKGEYFRAQISTNNASGAVWLALTNLAVLNNGGNPDITVTNTGNAFLPQTPESFTYDADGNLAQDGRWQYTWDGENRLVTIEALAGLPTAAKYKLDLTYDMQGRRVQKLLSTNSGSGYVAQYTNRFAYDGWNLFGILNPQLAVLQSFTWGLDLSGSLQGAGGVGGLLALNDSINGVQFATFDGNGNLSALTKAIDSTTAARCEYGPFGEIIRATGPMAKASPFRFSTKYQDETDLLYYGYRYYSPNTGRWLARDPVGPKGGLNVYALAENQPARKIDRLGLAGTDLSHFSDLNAGPCGNFSWKITWSLAQNQGHADPDIGGIIVQVVQAYFNVRLCDTAQSRFHFGPPSKLNVNPSDWPFYELWSIPPDKSHPVRTGTPWDDYWQMPDFGEGTQGTITIIGKADYFDGQSPPWYFQPDPGSPSGELPTSRWFDSPAPPTSSVFRTLTATWNCCCHTGRTKVTTND